MQASQRFEHLFESHRRPDGSRWTGQQLDEATGGVVTRSYFTNLRKGRIDNPGLGQVSALAATFGVEPSYLVDRKEPPLLDAELLEGLYEETTRQITCEALRLPERERQVVLGIVRQFGAGGSPPSGQSAAPWPRAARGQLRGRLLRSCSIEGEG